MFYILLGKDVIVADLQNWFSLLYDKPLFTKSIIPLK